MSGRLSGARGAGTRGRRPARAGLQGLSLAAVALALIAAPAQARGRDHTPPGFAGLESALTCIPGPIGPGRSGSYHLRWQAATDNVTPSSKIVYEIYQATSRKGENVSKPTYTTHRGATSFDTPQLPSDESFFFVVRARDRAGNEERNTAEREGQNPCV